ncbi:acyl-CoA thioesterase [Paenalkalicoccus suaedae]|uniref:Acyl-CoA thioesterase n=1 Tax=Paenalkalicoccus suaedae TaxID=2592382 RepID=A0A859FIF0_9BACI|nr:thioesterase family protein [Paenalkalicoccus suaedae]QKS71976.1 acyl-CoA thioesterase [Paenalkalicoccus suaedae]
MALPAYIDDLNTWKEKFTYFQQIPVRFSETDAFGHVNNTVAFVYFEQARISYFMELGLMDDWQKESTIVVTADLQCDYVRQVKFGETLHVGVRVAHVGRSSIDVHYMIENDDRDLCMIGRGRIVQVNKETGKSQEWTDTMRNKFTQFSPA